MNEESTVPSSSHKHRVINTGNRSWIHLIFACKLKQRGWRTWDQYICSEVLTADAQTKQLASIARKRLSGDIGLFVLYRITSPLVHRPLTWPQVSLADLTSDDMVHISFCLLSREFLLCFWWLPLSPALPPWSLIAQGCRSQGGIHIFGGSVCNYRCIPLPKFLLGK